MSMTQNGVTTTRTPGQEQYEYYTVPARMTRDRKPRKMCQYDYRAPDGELFSCRAGKFHPCLSRIESARSKARRPGHVPGLLVIGGHHDNGNL